MSRLPTPQQFGQILAVMADRHRFMDRAASLGLTGRWLEQTLDLTGIQPGQRVGIVVGADPGLEAGVRRRLGRDGVITTIHPDQGGQGHGLSFDVVMAAFALQAVEAEELCRLMARVTRAGGLAVLLDVTSPSNAVTRTYLRSLVPRLGNAIARLGEARFESPPMEMRTPLDIAHLLQRAGFHQVRYRILSPGLVAVHRAVKAGNDAEPTGHAGRPPVS